MKSKSDKREIKTKAGSWEEVDKQLIGGTAWSIEIGVYEDRRWQTHINEGMSFEQENKKLKKNLFKGEV